MSGQPPLIEADDLGITFDLGRRGLFTPPAELRAVQGVDLAIAEGETLGLVGESGSGKSTLGRLLIGALRPSTGRVRLRGEDITHSQSGRWRELRRELQLIQQNPATALDPLMTIGDQLQEVLAIHRSERAGARKAAVASLLARVGVDASASVRYPHELSGGQQQRIAIARALLVQPKFIVCDEPVSALDVSVQAQVLNLLQDLQAALRLTYLLISHDIHVIKHMSRRIAVMYLGRIVEIGPREAVLGRPLHPYTRVLLAAVPVPDAAAAASRFAPPLAGEPPDPAAPPAGCAFHPRCPLAIDRCRSVAPILAWQGTPARQVACHVATDQKVFA